MTMKTLELTVSFATPAFLGDARQSGAWRTPPFKALLRHWWRVAVARECNYDVEVLRRRELALFGSAADKAGGKSKVYLRLDEWRPGKGGDWRHLPKVCHPEVDLSWVSNQRARSAAFCSQHKAYHRIDADVYLGYGPIGLRGVERPPFVSPSERNSIWIRGPEAIEKAVQLASWFGTMGSRSRNGWGSLFVKGQGIKPFAEVLNGQPILRPYCRPLVDCLQLDWPHAFGKDEQGALVWKSKKDFDSWEKAMTHLAEIKIAFRTILPVSAPSTFADRHVLAYPVTNHQVSRWGAQERMANQIRFKVVPSDEKRWYALVYHLPSDIPADLKNDLGPDAPSRRDQARIWRTVHQVLDARMHRLGGLA